MSRTFTASLRTGPQTLSLGSGNDHRLSLRVQIPELWETLRVVAPADTSVATLKERVLEVLMPAAEYPEDFVMKLAGWEVLDENASLAGAGAKDGSTFVLMGRRRRPVR